LVDVQCWVREKDHRIQFRKPIEQKESVKWLKSFEAAQRIQRQCPDTVVVSVGDSEADLYELYLKAQGEAPGAKFLVRAYRSRKLAGSDQQLWNSLRQKESSGTVTVTLPRRGNRRARQAQLSVRFGKVRVQAPQYMSKGTPAVWMWAVMLEEGQPPEAVQGVCWMLLTNLPVETFEQAVEKTQWYGQRFGIEVYFRTLKSGCRMEDRQLGTAQRLENCLAIDLMVAWRITYLIHQGRAVPQACASAYFEEMQWKALVAYVKKDWQAVHGPPPQLGEAVRMVAQLGGFLGRKSDGHPGAQTLWRGWQRLEDIALGFALAWERLNRPVPSNTDYG